MTIQQTVSNGENEARIPKQKQFGKRPVRPDFTARDDKVKTLQAKVKEYVELSKAKTTELEALQNESKGNSKMEALKRSLANIVHMRGQVQVRRTHAIGLKLSHRINLSQGSCSMSLCRLTAQQIKFDRRHLSHSTIFRSGTCASSAARTPQGPARP
jgi:hypothetical protein